jgi:large subunit ribosomal protein L13e
MGMFRPMVEAHGGKRLRKGKGFSIEELKKAKINLQFARSLGIAVDRRRHTVRKENIETLKNILNSLSTGSKQSRRKSKKDSNKE